MLLSITRDRRWSSWAVEHLSKEHVADHITQGSLGWWKWITNKHKSGKLQASAPELLQLRKTIRQKQLHGGKKPDRKSQVCWDRTTMPPSLHRAHLLLHSLDLFTSTFSKDQNHLSDCPLTKKWHQYIFIMRDVTWGARKAHRVGLTGLVRHSRRSENMNWIGAKVDTKEHSLDFKLKHFLVNSWIFSPWDILFKNYAIFIFQASPESNIHRAWPWDAAILTKCAVLVEAYTTDTVCSLASSKQQTWAFYNYSDCSFFTKQSLERLNKMKHMRLRHLFVNK